MCVYICIYIYTLYIPYIPKIVMDVKLVFWPKMTAFTNTSQWMARSNRAPIDSRCHMLRELGKFATSSLV